MASADTLTIAFLEAHPARAARVLERLPGPEAAALFTRVPARVGGPVFTGGTSDRGELRKQELRSTQVHHDALVS